MPTQATQQRRSPSYEGGALSQAELQARRAELRKRHGEAVGQVTSLARTQRAISEELGAELTAIREGGAELDEIEAAASESGLLAVLTRAFARRRTILQRRSVAEGLLARYEAASACLRRASAFADELRLCSLELQQQVDHLHAELQRTKRNRTAAAEAVLALEEALAGVEQGEGDLDADARARRLDELHFRQRSEALSLELFQAAEGLLREELPPARSLRDTVQELHGEMARFVLGAESTLQTAGRRIQALGMAADAPMVIAELRESLSDLDGAMQATERYVEQAQHLLTRVLPELNAELEARARSEGPLLVDDLDAISRDRARELADRALREAADEEIDALVGGP